MKSKGLFTPSEYGSRSEKGQRTSKKDQRINGKHQKRIFVFAFVRCELALIPDNVLPESLHVNEESQHSHRGRYTAEQGPESDPELSKRSFVFVEVVTEAGHGAVGLVAGGDAVEVGGGLVGDAHQRVAAVAAAVPLGRAFVRRWTGSGVVRIPAQ